MDEAAAAAVEDCDLACCVFGASLYGAAALAVRRTAFINNTLAPLLQARAAIVPAPLRPVTPSSLSIPPLEAGDSLDCAEKRTDWRSRVMGPDIW